jgi:hypothetical protein
LLHCFLFPFSLAMHFGLRSPIDYEDEDDDEDDGGCAKRYKAHQWDA